MILLVECGVSCETWVVLRVNGIYREIGLFHVKRSDWCFECYIRGFCFT